MKRSTKRFLILWFLIFLLLSFSSGIIKVILAIGIAAFIVYEFYIGRK